MSGFSPFGGFRLREFGLWLSDLTTNNASTTKHGFCPKLPGSASQFLDGTGAFSTPGGAGAGLTFSGVRLRQSTNTAISNNTSTTLSFDTEVYDTDGYHEGVTNPDRITVPATGYYRLTLALQWASNSTATRYIWITRNGTATVEGTVGGQTASSASSTTDQCITVTVQATASDYFLARCLQSSGGNLNVVALNPSSPTFTCERLGA